MLDNYFDLEHEKAWTHNVSVPISLNYTDIEAVLVGAFEGGSNYWIEKLKFEFDRPQGMPSAIHAAKELLANREVKIRDEEGWHVLTLGNMAKGIEKFIQLRAGQKALYLDNGKPDWGHYDADDCDLVLQYALFGEAVYG